MKLNLCLLLALLLLVGCASSLDTEDQQASELYETAKEAIERGDYETAVTQLEALQARFPFGVYSEQAQLDIIYAYYEDGEPDSAVAAADRFIRLNPRHARVPYAWYMKGLAEQGRGQNLIADAFDLQRSARDPEPLRRAFDAFQTLIERYPDSEYVADARNRMISIRDQLADHELTVARFYIEREAWVAAANRAKTVLERYPQAPATDDALLVLEQAYNELELTQLKEDVRRILELNAPGDDNANKPASQSAG